MTGLVLSPDGHRVYSCGPVDCTIMSHSTKSGHLLQVFCGHQSHVTSVAVSPDGRNIFTSDATGTVKAWCTTGNVFSQDERTEIRRLREERWTKLQKKLADRPRGMYIETHFVSDPADFVRATGCDWSWQDAATAEAAAAYFAEIPAEYRDERSDWIQFVQEKRRCNKYFAGLFLSPDGGSVFAGFHVLSSATGQLLRVLAPLNKRSEYAHTMAQTPGGEYLLGVYGLRHFPAQFPPF